LKSSRVKKLKSLRTTSAPGRVVMKRIPLKAIKVARYNPRKDLQPGDADYEKLKRSIAEFGYVGGLVWNKRTGNLVGGHQRLKVLRREFGAEHADVSVVDLDPRREKLLNLALNKIVGEWDDLALADVLGGLMEGDGADATLSGFDEAEIKAALALTVGADKEETPGRTRAEMPRIAGWAVMVICASKRDQGETLGELRAEGYAAQAVKI